MPFLLDDDPWRITIALSLPRREGPIIRLLLIETQRESERLVKRVYTLLEQLERANAEIDQASLEDAGLTKVGELEYGGDRLCSMNGYRVRLRYELADAIGYTLPPLNNF